MTIIIMAQTTMGIYGVAVFMVADIIIMAGLIMIMAGEGSRAAAQRADIMGADLVMAAVDTEEADTEEAVAMVDDIQIIPIL